MNYEIAERVDRLEDLLGQFIVQTNTSLNLLTREVANLSNEMRIFKAEMKDFKDEMRVFKDEMADFKDEMRVFKDEMADFKDEMRVFKDEMTDFKDEMIDFKDWQKEQTFQMNKQWGDLANKMGTMVEDLVFPSISKIVSEKYNLTLEWIMVRVSKKLKDGRIKEFDLIAISQEFVFLNSTKSTLDSVDVKDFVKEIGLFWEFFPEYRGKKLIGLLASLNVNKSVLTYAERKGFLVLGVGMEIMEIKNQPDFKAKEWIYKAN